MQSDCVDSGQAGFFESEIYRSDSEEFYDEVCEITLADEAWGVIPNGMGVVSSTGFGDGGYAVFVERGVGKGHNGKIASIEIVFIDENMKEKWDELEAENS